VRGASFNRALFVFLIATVGALVALPYAPHLSRSEVVVGSGIVAALVAVYAILWQNHRTLGTDTQRS